MMVSIYKYICFGLVAILLLVLIIWAYYTLKWSIRDIKNRNCFK